MKTTAAIMLALVLLPGCLPPQEVPDAGSEPSWHGCEGGASPDAADPLEPVAEIDCGELATNAGDGSALVSLAIPPESYLAWVSVQVVPPQNHASLPAVLPVVEVLDATPPGGKILASTIDHSSDLASYEAPHRVFAIVGHAGPGHLPQPGSVPHGRGIGEGVKTGTQFVGWVCGVRLGTCVDQETGEALRDGVSCGTAGACADGACDE